MNLNEGPPWLEFLKTGDSKLKVQRSKSFSAVGRDMKGFDCTGIVKRVGDLLLKYSQGTKPLGVFENKGSMERILYAGFYLLFVWQFSEVVVW